MAIVDLQARGSEAQKLRGKLPEKSFNHLAAQGRQGGCVYGDMA